ncbi:MAG: BatA domain-containing protein [Flavobacteriaceae bacterium]
MQFKNPEVLYFLLALIFPILVHLFQLQRFKKIVFTNVSFLKKIELQTRKSSQLKKWLILATRMLLFSCIIFAFSQPYFSQKNSAEKLHNYIYLDNSISLNSLGEKGKLLPIAAQEIIENISDENIYSLITNSNYYPRLSAQELKNVLKKVNFTTKGGSIDAILLKINAENKNETRSLDNIILMSDFQNIEKYKNKKFTNVKSPISLLKLETAIKNNISVDSIFISDRNETNFTLNVVVKNQGLKKDNVPISIFNDTKLISKRSFSIEKNSKKSIDFEIQNSVRFLGEIKIQNNDAFLFDNNFFFTINFDEKINVLSIGKKGPYFSKIFTQDEFVFTEFSETKINYNTIPKQQLIILNELDDIPASLSTSLQEFIENGGSLLIVPSISSAINSYNSFFSVLKMGRISKNQRDSLKITTIHYDHPLFKNVFTKKIQNFQYPSVFKSFKSTFEGVPLLSYESNSPFLLKSKLKKGAVYWFSAPININNSNFSNSPLIVPTLYNIGQNSLRITKPYYILHEKNTIELNSSIGKDNVVSMSNKTTTFIPLQQNSQNKVSITTTDNPDIKGFYHIILKDTLQTVSYNNPLSESLIDFADINSIADENKNMTVYNSISDFFSQQNQKNEVHWLWKLFLALAIVSLLLEILILKFFKT